MSLKKLFVKLLMRSSGRETTVTLLLSVSLVSVHVETEHLSVIRIHFYINMFLNF